LFQLLSAPDALLFMSLDLRAKGEQDTTAFSHHAPAWLLCRTAGNLHAVTVVTGLFLLLLLLLRLHPLLLLLALLSSRRAAAAAVLLVPFVVQQLAYGVEHSQALVTSHTSRDRSNSSL
jgi:hypothetical protein